MDSLPLSYQGSQEVLHQLIKITRQPEISRILKALVLRTWDRKNTYITKGVPVTLTTQEIIRVLGALYQEAGTKHISCHVTVSELAIFPY